MDMLAIGVGEGVVEEQQPFFSAGGEEAVMWVVDQVCAGGSLYRIATAHAGFIWILMPSSALLRTDVGEAAAADPRLMSDDGPVGRISWEFRCRI